jgi:hypothetical protein
VCEPLLDTSRYRPGQAIILRRDGGTKAVLEPPVRIKSARMLLVGRSRRASLLAIFIRDAADLVPFFILTDRSGSFAIRHEINTNLRGNGEVAWTRIGVF